MAKPLFTYPEIIFVPREATADGGVQDGEACGSEEGRRVGDDIWEMICDALRREPEDRRVRALGECVRRFPRETLRHPEVFGYLEHLAGRGCDGAVRRILDDLPRRGRPARTADEEFHETAIVEGIIAREGCSASQAAVMARMRHPKVFGHKTERSIENDYSRTREAYRLAIQARWVPGCKLTDAPWSRSNGGARRR